MLAKELTELSETMLDREAGLARLPLIQREGVVALHGVIGYVVPATLGLWPIWSFELSVETHAAGSWAVDFYAVHELRVSGRERKAYCNVEVAVLDVREEGEEQT